MRIGIDASRTTVARRTGTEVYSLAITRALLNLSTGHSWELYFRDDPPPDLFPSSRAERIVIRQPRLWTHLGLSARLRRAPPDCLFVPAHTLPLYHPCPSVVTVHDLGYLHFPAAHPLGQRLYLDGATRFSALSATALIADSQATRRDLVKHYRVPETKAAVVYPGLDPALKPVRDPGRLAALRAHYGLPERFLLHVGTIQPRKNLERLIDACDTTQIALVLAGRPGWMADTIYETGRARGVCFLDYVADDDLAALYSAAALYVCPSLYEGFGFTVLEAMACGAPVVCSDGGSLPEVAGEAALVVPARETRALAEAIRRVLADESLRRDLIAKGLRNVERFSWDRAAQQTLQVLESAVQRSTARR
jgi:glycosyltransferase involved in cell wall biosynthesis